MSDDLKLESLELLGQRLGAALYPAPVSRRLRLAWLMPIGALAAVAASAAVVLIGAGTSVTPAAQALDRAARAVEQKSAVTPVSPGRFWYTRTISELPVPVSRAAWRSRGLSGGTSQAGMSMVIGRPEPARPLPVPGIGVERVLSETWVAPDGTIRTRLARLGAPRFATAEDRTRFRASGASSPAPIETVRKGDGYFPPGLRLFTYSELVALPTTPDRLYSRLSTAIRDAELRIQGGRALLARADKQESAAQTLGAITTMLAYPLPQPLRAALYRAAALIPGTHYDGATHDLSGRRGVGISVGGIELIFSPSTGNLLGEQAPGPGGETLSMSVLATAVTNTSASASVVKR